MNDHELDDQMRLLAQSYNEPPATPREAMWARIEGARRGATPIVLGTSRRIRWLRMSAGIAAVLVVGIGIGRLSRGAGRAMPGAAVAAALHAPVGDSGTGRPFVRVASDAESTSDKRQPPAALASTAQGTAPTNPVRATRDERLRALREQRSATSPALAAYGVGRSAQGVVGEGSEVSAYRLAVIEHMARTEVLLTSFLAESRNGPTGTPAAAQFASLSRDLLKTTRLLLATRTADDPALTRLLEDLELVLMQISQYTAEGRRGDLDAINQSLDRRNVLPKLRATIPAGASASAGI
jgi:hypothetical protein